jgi:hypothetical protein
MTINLSAQRVNSTVPAAFVTKGRQRVKQFGDTVYLNNGDEFELELFNPTNNKVLAKINLNGKSLGSGIVLRPGERVFLERYLEEARKFLFETYVVDGADSNVKEAIRLNGRVDVEFFDEMVTHNVYQGSSITWSNPSWNPSWTNYNGSGGWGGSTLTSGNSSHVKGMNFERSANDALYETKSFSGPKSRRSPVMDSMETSQMFLCSCSLHSDLEMPASPQPLETGRVEKGSQSYQGFTTDSTQFNSYYSWKTTWNIKPDSQRPIVIEDVKVFCTGCGKRRRKSSDAFCSKCGTKF